MTDDKKKLNGFEIDKNGVTSRVYIPEKTEKMELAKEKILIVPVHKPEKPINKTNNNFEGSNISTSIKKQENEIIDLKNEIILLEESLKSKKENLNILNESLKSLIIKNNFKIDEEETLEKEYRDQKVAILAKKISQGKCGRPACENPIPFLTSGRSLLESHHIVWISNKGEDEIENVIALCPNCHRYMHRIADEIEVQDLLDHNKNLISTYNSSTVFKDK